MLVIIDKKACNSVQATVCFGGDLHTCYAFSLTFGNVIG